MSTTAICSLAYESSIRTPFGAGSLASLERSVIAQNLLYSVSGALIYDGKRFYQYIEGPASGVERAYARISASRRHSITRLFPQGLAPERYFPHWFMLVKDAELPVLSRASEARWKKAEPSLPTADEMPISLLEFIKFWKGD